MKKAVIITVILAFVVGGGVLWKIRENRLAAKAAYLEAKATEGQAYNKGFTPSKYDVGPPDAQEILELVNQERERVGVKPLVMDTRMNASAQEKADDMMNRNYRDHVSPEGVHGYELVFKYAVNECKYASENISWGTGGKAGTSKEVFNAWMNSEPHRKALQDPKYTKTGVGVNKDITVQHFCELNQ